MAETKCKRGFQSHVMCDCESAHPLTPREKVLLKPCPFCGGEAVAGSNFDNDHYVMCGADCDKCGGMVGYMKTEMAAIENWNRRTALASGSGDHAELARLAESATPGPWKSIIDDTGGERSGWPLCIVPEDDDNRSVVRTGGMWPYEWDAKVSRHEAVATAAFIAAANPATVLALLAEIAALNDYGRSVAKEALGYRDQATEAERKLAEAVGLLERIGFTPDGEDGLSLSECVTLARTFLSSKEAERGPQK